MLLPQKGGFLLTLQDQIGALIVKYDGRYAIFVIAVETLSEIMNISVVIFSFFASM
jgi:hypothetical protein